MPSSAEIENRFKTFAMVVVFGIFVIYIPLWIAARETPAFLPALGALRWIGPILITLGIVGYIMSIWRFISEAAASPMLGDSQKLIIKGIYRYTRNPIYVSVWMVLLGESVYFASLDLLYYLLLWILIFKVVVRFAEEPYLRVQFGEDYKRYCREVPRWFPVLWKRKNNG
jgi:protein-S-isoprenylcysteine O-methyltransferase Ste14